MSAIYWQKSSLSGGQGENCVEIAVSGGAILVRESDDPDVIVSTTPAKLRTLILGVKLGEFDHLI